MDGKDTPENTSDDQVKSYDEYPKFTMEQPAIKTHNTRDKENLRLAHNVTIAAEIEEYNKENPDNSFISNLKKIQLITIPT